MSGIYERLAARPGGPRRLAAARLRYEVLGVLHKALDVSGLMQKDLARILGVRKSAVNQVLRGDGNLRINTLAEYLHACGYELTLGLAEAGEPRRAAQEDRPVTAVFSAATAPQPVARARSRRSYHVLPEVPALMELTWAGETSRGAEMRFEGAIHRVPSLEKAESFPRNFGPAREVETAPWMR